MPDDTSARLGAIERRLAAIEQTLLREQELREQLARCEQSRRELAEQARHLIDRLGEAHRKPATPTS